MSPCLPDWISQFSYLITTDDWILAGKNSRIIVTALIIV